MLVGIIRQFVPDYLHPGVRDALVDAGGGPRRAPDSAEDQAGRVGLCDRERRAVRRGRAARRGARRRQRGRAARVGRPAGRAVRSSSRRPGCAIRRCRCRRSPHTRRRWRCCVSRSPTRTTTSPRRWRGRTRRDRFEGSMPVGDPSPPTDDPLIGKVLSERYRIVRKIGEGGMGAVYQAEHALIEKKIALKILFQDLTRRPDLVARFLQEAKSASRIGHENVIDISDFGQSPDGPGLHRDGVPRRSGPRASSCKQSGAMPWERARPILMQIAKGAARRARQRDHPPRHEAGERLPRPARGAPRLRQGARLRHRQDHRRRRRRRSAR